MNGNRILFTQLEENAFDQVQFGGNNQVDIIDKGTIAFKVKFSKTMQMHDTLYVPGLKHNLLSIVQMCLKYYCLV